MDQGEKGVEAASELTLTQTSGSSVTHHHKTRLINKIHTIKSLDNFFFEVREEIHRLFEAEQATI
ncbi:MAG: hypothetical protein ETSY1_00650 [Candidatus Entotheonella factor]|uniref:Uncharacterized protein n=1 Tax=Entotheonella factor TaxID=1429438 RepID=W4LZD0_ENTF1|nr:hypothetical protein [Candidatus Entotheonella palauensis]ETX03258.1 MAG: hypothetical protein ETSY1_00650 [Candidatus Entotheonella factor]